MVSVTFRDFSVALTGQAKNSFVGGGRGVTRAPQHRAGGGGGWCGKGAPMTEQYCRGIEIPPFRLVTEFSLRNSFAQLADSWSPVAFALCMHVHHEVGSPPFSVGDPGCLMSTVKCLHPLSLLSALPLTGACSRTRALLSQEVGGGGTSESLTIVAKHRPTPLTSCYFWRLLDVWCCFLELL